MERAPGVAIGNDTVEADLVKVGSLKLQHLVDTSAVYLIRGLEDLLVITFTAEAGSDQLLAVLVKKVECGLVCTCRDLDQLSKAISDLCLGKSLQEREVQECVDGSVVCTQPVFIVAVVNSNLDTDTGIDEADDCSGNTDEVCTSAVCGTSKSRSDELALFSKGFPARVP